jgi:hypothetical protein
VTKLGTGLQILVSTQKLNVHARVFLLPGNHETRLELSAQGSQVWRKMEYQLESLTVMLAYIFFLDSGPPVLHPGRPPLRGNHRRRTGLERLQELSTIEKLEMGHCATEAVVDNQAGLGRLTWN